MAELFTHPEQHGAFLKRRYLWELWKALLEHAPSVMAYLREHGVSAWLERYGLPDGLRDWVEEYRADPEGYVLMGWDWGDSPPETPRLEQFIKHLSEYDPTRMTAGRWREYVLDQLNSYIQSVEEAYIKAGWQKTRLKHGARHFTWFALWIEGFSCAQIAERLELKQDYTAIRLAVRRLERLLAD